MGVLVTCVLVFTVFCIVCTVLLYCFVYVYLFLFVLSVLLKGLLPPSDNSIAVTTTTTTIIIIIIIIIIIMIIITIINNNNNNNQAVHTDREVTANRPDIIMKNKKEKTRTLIDVAIPADRNVVQKEAEKKLKYKSLCIEIQ